MYEHILVPLENSPTDTVILGHVRALATKMGARITLIHVADGFVALNRERFNLADSEEIIRDRAYLEKVRSDLASSGLKVEAVLVCGDPTTKILEYTHAQKCDLIAMSTHGHRFIGDFIWGSVASKVRHRTEIPVLLLKAPTA